MNKNSGLSILNGQEIIKEEFEEDELEEVYKAYNSIKKIIIHKKSFNDLNFKDYKKIISKINKKLEDEEELDEEEVIKLKTAKTTIFNIIFPQNRIIHINSIFIDSLIQNNGQWVIFDGIELSPKLLLEKIEPLCETNPEINYYESGKKIVISSKEIKENFRLFLIHNPFNNENKIINHSLFKKCTIFNLPSINDSINDLATIFYNNLVLSDEGDKIVWNILSLKLASCHVYLSKLIKNINFLKQKENCITLRNFIFMLKDINNSDFDDTNINEIVKWIKSSLSIYYFNSITELFNKNKTIEINKDIYDLDKFKKEIYKIFKKRQNLIFTSNIKEEEMFPEIISDLFQIQIASSNEFSQFNFNLGKFVKSCIEIPIEKTYLEYIINQMEDTIILLNNSNFSKESFHYFYQIKIVKQFYIEILKIIDSVKIEDKRRKLNSDELLKVNSLKPILLKFRLLEELTNKGDKNFGLGMNSNLYIPEINKLILKINSLLSNKNKKSFKKFISFCLKNHQFLKVTEIIFPYNKFNKECIGTYFDIAFYYIKMMVEFYKNKTNFIIIFDDNDEYPFIFESQQYDRLFPILKLNEKNNIYLSKGTMIKIYLSQNIINKVKEINLIHNDEESNKKNTIHFLKFFTEYSGKIKPEDINYLLDNFNKDNNDLVSQKKFLTSNFFLSSYSIIPKMWTLLFSFDEESEILKYIIDNFLPFEKDIYNILKNNFFNILNEKNQITKYVEFTNKMDFFYNENSFLFKNMIGKKLEKELSDEEYKMYEKKVEIELSNLEQLKNYSWPMKNYNEYQQILDTQLEVLKLINSQNELKQLKKKLLDLDVKGGLEIYKQDYINNINNLLKKNLNEILNNKNQLEKEIDDLILVSKEKDMPLLGNDLNWGNLEKKNNHYNNSSIIKFYKNILYYSECDELLQKYLDLKDNKERIRYGIKIEKLGLQSILKYIISSKNKVLYIENNKIIKSMYRAKLMYKVWNDSISQINIKHFIKNINEKSLRLQISQEEYEFSYLISSKYSLKTKIIKPKFEPKDIIYLFFEFKGNDEFTLGPIFDEINIDSSKLNYKYNKILNTIKSKNLDKMCDITMLFLKTMKMMDSIKKNNEPLPENFDDLLIFFENEIEKKVSLEEKKTLGVIIDVMKLSKSFDDIIKYNEITKDPPIFFDDMIIFKSKDENVVDIESLISKKINPSLKFYIINNMELINNLFNLKLKREDISDLFNPKCNINYIPFWVYLIRNLSSINCTMWPNLNLKKIIKIKK